MLLAIACSFPVSAADGAQPGEPEIWLVTYGPGEIYWQRFGHNAIWVRDPGLGLDHVFNFGFFDFQQEDFFVRFLKGRMLYFSAARPAQEEFTSYINENRSIRAQRLDLSSDQKLVLTEHLLAEIRPENRDYLYDYYLNNCSTRVRDAIDLAMGGLLKAEFLPRPATQTWRDHTRRLTHADFWLYLGLEIGLGSPVDQTISRWDEMFIPELLAESLASLEYAGGEAGRPLVVEDVALFTSSIVSPPASPHAWWPRYLLASLIVLLAAALLCRFVGSRGAVLLARCWLVLSGAIGVVLLFFWLGTDHSVTRFNMNLLVVCPAWLLLAFWTDNEQRVLQIIAVVSSLAVALFWLPPHQYNADVLAAFIPLNLASAYGLFRYRSLSANRPDVPASADR
ncbi:MAG: DUF4105 domain-containing protein [Xanthomonadales bacterium]|nr:DUF4105 domain-containing protein [Xanthomonadales bacterium]